MLAAALTELARGASVLPVAPDGSKRPLVPWMEFQRRHPTEAEVRSWWTQYPDAWLGIVTGAISNLVVVDVDGQVDHPDDFRTRHALPATEAVRTPRGGVHYYYTHPGTERTVQNGVRIATLEGLPVDLRGDGGFVVAPPSPGYKPSYGGSFERAPYTSVKLLTPVPTQPASIDAILADSRGVEDLFAPAPQGQRNDAAARLAGYLLKTCTDPMAAWVQLAIWNQRNAPPLPERELRRTFESIAHRDAGNRQQLPTTGNTMPPGNSEPDWLEGGAWATFAANEPTRRGQLVDSLPLAEKHQGFCPGDLIAIAGRPGTGKSALVWQTAWELGMRLGESLFIFSGDMSPSAILNWMTRSRLRQPSFTREDWQESLRQLSASKMAMKHGGRIEASRIRYMLEHRPGTRYVLIDHFNKMVTGANNRSTELSFVAVDLKELANEFGVTLLVLAQLNRMGHGDQHINTTHLAESDGLVKESDVIYGLTQIGDPSQQDPERATVRLTLLKNRFGQDHIDQHAYFHKGQRAYEWLPRDRDWSQVG